MASVPESFGCSATLVRVPVPRERRKETKQRERRQQEAAVTKVTERAHNKGSTEQHLFTKYLDIRMIKEDCTRIVTGVDFVLDRAC
jgi:transcription antitermination factor NusG